MDALLVRFGRMQRFLRGLQILARLLGLIIRGRSQLPCAFFLQIRLAGIEQRHLRVEAGLKIVEWRWRVKPGQSEVGGSEIPLSQQSPKHVYGVVAARKSLARI